MSRIRKSPPGVDPELLRRDAAKLMPEPTRRLFLRSGASLGALAFLTGCDIVDSASAEHVLMKISYFNDRAQAWLFNSNKLAPTYPDSAVRRPFPFNAYYPEEDAPEVDKDDYKLEVGGMVDDKKSWTLDELYALPQETQITRLVCVEGWSAIGKWTGTPRREFLRRVLLRIIGVERKRPPDRAVGVGRRKLVRIEQPCLRPVIEIGNFHQHVFRRRSVDDVAAGEEGERPETRAAAQEEAARGIGHESRSILDEERGIDAGWALSNA